MILENLKLFRLWDFYELKIITDHSKDFQSSFNFFHYDNYKNNSKIPKKVLDALSFLTDERNYIFKWFHFGLVFSSPWMKIGLQIDDKYSFSFSVELGFSQSFHEMNVTSSFWFYPLCQLLFFNAFIFKLAGGDKA